jgi:hypothetical protein
LKLFHDLIDPLQPNSQPDWFTPSWSNSSSTARRRDEPPSRLSDTLARTEVHRECNCVVPSIVRGLPTQLSVLFGIVAVIVGLLLIFRFRTDAAVRGLRVGRVHPGHMWSPSSALRHRMAVGLVAGVIALDRRRRR